MSQTSKDPIGFAGDGTNLYGYAISDPINFVDMNGEFAEAAMATAGGMVFLPIPGARIVAGAIVVGTVVAIISWEIYNYYKSKKKGDTCPKPPKDPSKPPGKGWEWRGKGKPGNGEGSWHNPETGESLHPDLKHPQPIGPHWDYTSPGGPKIRIPIK